MSVKILKAAEAYCTEKGLRFTDTRRLVLNIIAQSKKSVTAYEILDALEGHVKNPKPPIVYRATDFWQAHGFVHKIESLNAFVVCREDHQHQGSQFMICDDCGSVSEVHLCHLPNSLSDEIKAQSFAIHFWNLEIHGRCQSCA